MKQEVQDQVLLELLSSIERNSGLTQRTIARELGIALGLANTYPPPLRTQRPDQDLAGPREPLHVLPHAARLQREIPPHGKVSVELVQPFSHRARAVRSAIYLLYQPRSASGRIRWCKRLIPKWPGYVHVNFLSTIVGIVSTAPAAVSLEGPPQPSAVSRCLASSTRWSSPTCRVLSRLMMSYHHRRAGLCSGSGFAPGETAACDETLRERCDERGRPALVCGAHAAHAEGRALLHLLRQGFTAYLPRYSKLPAATHGVSITCRALCFRGISSCFF